MNLNNFLKSSNASSYDDQSSQFPEEENIKNFQKRNQFNPNKFKNMAETPQWQNEETNNEFDNESQSSNDFQDEYYQKLHQQNHQKNQFKNQNFKRQPPIRPKNFIQPHRSFKTRSKRELQDSPSSKPKQMSSQDKQQKMINKPSFGTRFQNFRNEKPINTLHSAKNLQKLQLLNPGNRSKILIKQSSGNEQSSHDKPQQNMRIQKPQQNLNNLNPKTKIQKKETLQNPTKLDSKVPNKNIQRQTLKPHGSKLRDNHNQKNVRASQPLRGSKPSISSTKFGNNNLREATFKGQVQVQEQNGLQNSLNCFMNILQNQSLYNESEFESQSEMKFKTIMQRYEMQDKYFQKGMQEMIEMESEIEKRKATLEEDDFLADRILETYKQLLNQISQFPDLQQIN